MIQIPVYEPFCNVHKISKSNRLNLFAQNNTQHFRLSGLKLCNFKFYAWKNYVFTLGKFFTATDSKLKICDFQSFYRSRLFTPQRTLWLGQVLVYRQNELDIVWRFEIVTSQIPSGSLISVNSKPWFIRPLIIRLLTIPGLECVCKRSHRWRS